MMDMQKIKSLKRIKKEYDDINKNPIGNIGVTTGLPNEENIYEWRCSLLGPKCNDYSGGLFFLKIHFPVNYPEAPPEICFKTPIYHPNINPFKPKKEGDVQLGYVSLDILKYWKPEYSMKETFLNLFVLLIRPNPDINCSYNSEIVEEYNDERKLYYEKVKYFTKKYANPRVASNDYSNSDWDFSVI